jgi:hypothetical protein
MLKTTAAATITFPFDLPKQGKKADAYPDKSNSLSSSRSVYSTSPVYLFITLQAFRLQLERFPVGTIICRHRIPTPRIGELSSSALANCYSLDCSFLHMKERDLRLLLQIISRAVMCQPITLFFHSSQSHGSSSKKRA